MSLVPLPPGTESFARLIAGLRADIQATPPRRLGQSSITSGVLDVHSGGTIRIGEGGRVVFDGGTLAANQVLASPSQTGLQVAAHSGRSTVTPGTAWTRCGTATLAPPSWARKVTMTANVTVTGRARQLGDVYVRAMYPGGAGPALLATWGADSTSFTFSYTGINVARVGTPARPLTVAVEAHTDVSVVEFTGRVDVAAIWQA